MTPEIAHEIGIKLAEEMWGDKFEVIVATHLNTNHIHNHFCLNSVSFMDGKKYYDNHANYALMRETSDRLCEEYNLSVLKEKKCEKSNIDYSKFYQNKVIQSSYYTSSKEDIDYAITQANSYNNFLNILKNMGYEVVNRNKKLSIRKKSSKRNIRIERSFGRDYTIQRIEQRILETRINKQNYQGIRNNPKRYKSIDNKGIHNKKKVKGIKALYLYYCYLLKIYPKNNQIVKSETLKSEIRKMENISKEARFLSRTGIETVQELTLYKKPIVEKRKVLKSKREYLWKKYNKGMNEEEKEKIYNEIAKISKEVKEIQQEERIIENIESRIPKMKEMLKEEQEKEIKGKEKITNEYVK